MNGGNLGFVERYRIIEKRGWGRGLFMELTSLGPVQFVEPERQTEAVEPGLTYNSGGYIISIYTPPKNMTKS